LRVLIWGALLALFALAFYLISGPKEAPKARTGGPITITTVTAQIGNVGAYLDAIGTVTPVYTASIFSQVTGVVVGVNYQEGNIVKKGNPLVDIDDRQYQATLVQAQGALQRDENILAQAQMDLDRYRAAWARNGVAKQILDDQEKLVLQDQGTVKNDQGAVQFDQLQVEYCHIAAPIAGRVGLRLVDPGNLVTAGTSLSSSATPLVVITQLQPITVVFTIAEDSLGAVMAQLRKGAKLTVDVYDRAAQTKLASGELLAVDNQIDTTTGTVKVRASFANNDFALFPNQFVNARLLVQTLQDVTLIPSATRCSFLR
jgi:membrane fusion protein, multidrug efflux system